MRRSTSSASELSQMSKPAVSPAGTTWASGEERPSSGTSLPRRTKTDRVRSLVKLRDRAEELPTHTRPKSMPLWLHATLACSAMVSSEAHSRTSACVPGAALNFLARSFFSSSGARAAPSVAAPPLPLRSQRGSLAVGGLGSGAIPSRPRSMPMSVPSRSLSTSSPPSRRPSLSWVGTPERSKRPYSSLYLGFRTLAMRAALAAASASSRSTRARASQPPYSALWASRRSRSCTLYVRWAVATGWSLSDSSHDVECSRSTSSKGLARTNCLGAGRCPATAPAATAGSRKTSLGRKSSGSLSSPPTRAGFASAVVLAVPETQMGTASGAAPSTVSTSFFLKRPSCPGLKLSTVGTLCIGRRSPPAGRAWRARREGHGARPSLGSFFFFSFFFQ